MTPTELNETIEDQSQPTRRKIILALKQQGSMTANELAVVLMITSMGVRRHLIILERDRLVQHELVQRGKGRPSYVYRLSQQAENLFQKNYAPLANELLGYLATQAGDAAVTRLFDQRTERRVRNARGRLDGLSLGERVAQVTEILNSEGYLAQWEQLDPNTFRIREHNCAIHDIAAEFDAACGSELAFMQAVFPDAEVVREQHVLAGETMCAYRIRRQREDRISDGTSRVISDAV
jgi:predicted ArsR family transcriptional regulator